MYVIKKCDNYGYGRNDWKVVFTSPDREAAVSHFRTEFRYILESDPNLSRSQIDNHLRDYYLDNRTGYWGSMRIVKQHNGIGFSLAKSSSVEYQEATARPDRTELLDSILG